MSDYRPLFVANLTRSGSYLIAQMLSANPAVNVAAEPFIELYRSLRNALVRVGASSELQQAFDPASPMQDYYFTDERIGLMDVVQKGDLSTAILDQEWEDFLAKTTIRTAKQCAELVPYLGELKGANYKEIFDNALEIITKARNVRDCKWIGIKEAWSIEFFASLARAYPEAKFLVIVRDPRAIINSMLAFIQRDPSVVAHVLSYARHWRKMVAFIDHYQRDPNISGRLYVVTHEQVLQDPAGKAADLCDFLEVEYDPRMIDTNNYIDYSTGTQWKGNSIFEEVTSGISVHRAERWREKLDPKALKMVEFACGHDMKLMGYEKTAQTTGEWPNPEVLEYIVQNGQAYANWRSDFEDPQKDYGFELFRHALITQSGGNLDSDLIRRSFLFEEVFGELRQLTV